MRNFKSEQEMTNFIMLSAIEGLEDKIDKLQDEPNNDRAHERSVINQIKCRLVEIKEYDDMLELKQLPWTVAIAPIYATKEAHLICSVEAPTVDVAIRKAKDVAHDCWHGIERHEMYPQCVVAGHGDVFAHYDQTPTQIADVDIA